MLDVDAMLDGLPGDQFLRWMAYSRVDPFTEERADLRSAIVATVIANANRGKGQRPFKIKDFMPDFRPHKVQTWQQMKSTFKAFAVAHNEALKRG